MPNLQTVIIVLTNTYSTLVNSPITNTNGIPLKRYAVGVSESDIEDWSSVLLKLHRGLCGGCEAAE